MENKIKIHQSIFKWLIIIAVLSIIFLLCYFNRNAVPKFSFQICMWIAIFSIGLGLIAILGVCIWLLFAKFVLVFDFNRNVITVKNFVLFSKRSTEVRFDEISKISIKRVGIYQSVYINVKEPHEKSGMTVDDGMLVSANIYFPTKKSLLALDRAVNRLKSRLNL